MRKTLLISILFLSQMTTTALASSCVTQLDLLDAPLKGALESIARLTVDVRASDPTTAMSVKLQGVLAEKSQALQDIIRDPQILAAASKYVFDLVHELEGSKNKGDAEAEHQESQSRIEELNNIVPYFALDEIRIPYRQEPIFTPDGVLITLTDGIHIFLKDVVRNITRELVIPEKSTNHTMLQYSRGSRELFVRTEERVRAISLDKIFKAPQTANLSVDDKSLDTRSRVLNDHQVEAKLNRSSPLKEIVRDTLFYGFIASDDGNILASTFDAVPYQFPWLVQQFAIYNRASGEFVRIKLPVEHSKSVLPWNLSGDGKTLITKLEQPEMGFATYDTSTGNQKRFIPLNAVEKISISHDGHWAAVYTEAKEVLVYDLSAPNESAPRSFELAHLSEEPQNARPDKIFFSPDSKKVVLGNYHNRFWVWNLETGALITSAEIKGLGPQLALDGNLVLTHDFPVGPGNTVNYLWKKRQGVR